MNRISVATIAIILVFTSLSLFAQNPKSANVWYFGERAGLDFSNGHPVALTDGAMSSFEGCATISDNLGNLQFYTNGGSQPYAGGVWNRNHQLMPNGDLTSAGGCNSSFQSSLIVNHIKRGNLYYIFSTDCIENGAVGGLRYHIVDMAQDGGLGDVVAKGNFLTGPVDESLTAVQHANGYDYWIIAHKLHTDSFYVYHLSGNGIVGVVKNKIGYVTPDYAGALKASTNGGKLVYTGLNWSSLFDFDNATGIISNHVDLGQPGYSATFSPNCKLLYVADGSGRNIYQFDVTKHFVAATKTLVGTTSSPGIGAMQIGPNGRIYVARFVSSNYLGVIEKPNFKGTASSYVDDGLFLAGQVGKGGLPNYANNTIGECINYPEENTTRFDASFLTANQITSNQFMLSWEKSNDVLGYRVMIRTEDGLLNKEFVTRSNFFPAENLDPNTTYEVNVLPITIDHDKYEFVSNHLTTDVINNGLKTNYMDDNQLTVTTLDNFEFILYPNPTSSNANISVNMGDEASDVTISMMDISGKVVGFWKHEYVSGYQNFSLPTDNLPNGMYSIAMRTTNGYSVKKLILAK